jgi:DNA-binding winged helix-turn-helix (wHTH) protein/tetratricopeptide (TPR) repeat protein
MESITCRTSAAAQEGRCIINQGNMSSQTGGYRFGSFELYPASRTVNDGREAVAITSRAFDVLLYMVRNPRRLLTKEELMKAVWADAAVEEGNLTQSVFLLRKALNGIGRSEPLIVTVPGRGYQFSATVEEIAPADEAPVQVALVGLPATHPPARRRLLLGLGISVAICSFGLTHYLHGTAPLTGPRQLVLADFENRTGEMVFDHSLRKALEIDLQQSPYFMILPEAEARQTLKLMEHSPDDALTTALAREVCQRNNSQAVLSGLIARFGEKYLITLDATDCASGKSLVQSKIEAAGRDGVPRALDRIGADIRERLGESMASIRQFDVPLFPERTGSLDALRSYSAGTALVNQGKLQESIPFFEHAIELDSDFAVAHLSLSGVYYTLGERDLEIPNISKAWVLRATVSERQRLAIAARYHQSVTGDLDEAARNYQLWTQTYPLDPVPWQRLANAENYIAQYPSAIDAAKHSLALNPRMAVVYVILARAYVRAGQYGNADTICRQAIATGLDGAEIHSLMLDTAFIRKDAAGVEAQMTWAQGKPAESLLSLDAAMMALSQGKARLALDLYSQTAELYRKQGLKERGNLVLANSTRLLFDMGLTAQARKLVDRLPPVDGQTDLIVAEAELGETSRASTTLDRDLKEFPSDTLWQKVRGPEIQAAILLNGHKPLEAIDALRPGVPYDLRNFDLNTIRGRAYLEAGQGQEAVGEYRKILDHQGVDPLSPDYPLAWLGAARGYALGKNILESRDAYEHFFAVWKDADADVPVLQQAKLEYAKLSK